jgi:hypothetical protein
MELFTNIQPSLSPRLLWMARHGITVMETGDPAAPWKAEHVETMQYAYGTDEVDAVQAMGRKLFLLHWSLSES